MVSQLLALSVDANAPRRLARFWAGVLGWDPADDPHDAVELQPSDDTGFRLRFLPTQERKTDQNRMHFDLTSRSLEDQRRTGRGLWNSAAGTSTSGNARRRATSSSPTPRATSSASSSRATT